MAINPPDQVPDLEAGFFGPAVVLHIDDEHTLFIRVHSELSGTLRRQFGHLNPQGTAVSLLTTGLGNIGRAGWPGSL